MGNIPSLNLQYIFARLYHLVTGVNVDVTQVPDQATAWMHTFAIFGIVLSVVLLALIVYVRIRTVQVEHHGFHELEKHEHELQYGEGAHEVKNNRWEGVSILASSPNESDWRRAIIDADSMLEAMLIEHGYIGDTLGEKLKLANPLQFTTLDLAWEAHRMRNAIAHLGDAFPVSERDVRATIDLYRRVFEEFHYI